MIVEPGPEVRQRVAGDPEHRVQVGLDGAVQVGLVELVEALVVHLVRRVVHQDVEPTEALHRVGDQRAAELPVPDVAGQQHRRAALRAHELRDGLRVHLLLGQVAQRHVRALARERDGHRRADAGVTAGDERLAARQATGAAVAGLAVVGLRVELRVQARAAAATRRAA